MNKYNDLKAEYLGSKIASLQNLRKLENEKTKLEADYTNLLIKYNKLLDNIISKDTKIFVYNNEVYEVTNLTFEKQPDSIDKLNLQLSKIATKEEAKGLINNLSDVFQNIVNTANDVLFGNKK